MGGMAQVVVKKGNDVRVIYTVTSGVQDLFRHPSFWNRDWEQFLERMMDEEEFNFEPYSHEEGDIIGPYHYGLVFVDWDKKIIHQAMSDYVIERWNLAGLLLSRFDYASADLETIDTVDPQTQLTQVLNHYRETGSVIFDVLTYQRENGTSDDKEHAFEISGLSEIELLTFVDGLKEMEYARHSEINNKHAYDLAINMLEQQGFTPVKNEKMFNLGIRMPFKEWSYTQTDGFSELQSIYDQMIESGIQFSEKDLFAWREYANDHEVEINFKSGSKHVNTSSLTP